MVTSIAAGESGATARAKLNIALGASADDLGVFNVKDTRWGGGALGDGSNNDYAAIQATIDHVAGLSKPGATIVFPPGTYNVGTAPTITDGKSITVMGYGQDRTIINATGSNAAFILDGGWRDRFQGIMFKQGSARTSGGAVFEQDKISGTLATQGIIYDDCGFDAGRNADYGLAISNTAGDNGQGSENQMRNCWWYRGKEACFASKGGNALQNNIIGGNFQDYDKYGAAAYSGIMHIYSTGFQPDGTLQLENGYADIYANFTAGERMMIQGCRSEGTVFYLGSASGPPVSMSACSTISVSHFGSRANNTAYSLGHYYVGITALGRRKLYKVTTAGTTTSAEPTWPETGTVADGTVTWTEQKFSVINNSVDGVFDNCRFPQGGVRGRGVYRRCSFGRFDVQNQQGNTGIADLEDCYVGDSGGGRTAENGIEDGPTAAQLADKTHQINLYLKYAGKQRWDITNKRWMCAAGSLATDTWTSMGPLSVGTVVTPS